jgi:hypothetical protein
VEEGPASHAPIDPSPSVASSRATWPGRSQLPLCTGLESHATPPRAYFAWIGIRVLFGPISEGMAIGGLFPNENDLTTWS